MRLLHRTFPSAGGECTTCNSADLSRPEEKKEKSGEQLLAEDPILKFCPVCRQSLLVCSRLPRSCTMAGNQADRQRKRSRASDAAERVAQPGDDQSKRRRVSNANAATKSLIATPQDDAAEAINGANTALQVEKHQKQASWSFSRPAGGRFSSSNPEMTLDEE